MLFFYKCSKLKQLMLVTDKSARREEKYLLGFGIGPQPFTIAASRARDKDMEAMRAEMQALCQEQQRHRDELMKEREEHERYYNEMLKEREECERCYNEILKKRELG